MIEEKTASSQAVEEAKKSSSTGEPEMHLKVYSPFKVYFDDMAVSVSAENATGPFDILPKHHRFMTLLTAGELVIRDKRGHEEKIRISGGLMHVKADMVAVFLDI